MMKDGQKIEKPLLDEMAALRRRIAELEAGEAERKKVEEALRESQERYRDLYDEAPNAYLSVGVDGRIKRANRRAAELFGYTGEDLLGRPVFDFVADSPAGRPRAQKVFRRFLAGEETRGEEIEFRRPDGGQVWGSLSVRPIRDSNGRIVATRSMVVDITHRKLAEEALRETSQHLQAIIETSPLPIIAMDPEGKVTRWNAAAERVFGWSEEEVLGHPLPFVPEDKQEEHRSLRERTLRGEIFTGKEVRRQRKDGSPIDISFSTSLLRDPEGQVEGIMGVMIDITERKQAEEALRRAHDELELRVQERTDALHESREHFRKLVETTNAIPWEADAKTWQFTYVGPQAVKLFGYPVDQWYEKDFWTAHIHPEDRDYAIDFCLKSSQSEDHYEFEYRMLSASGEIVWLYDIVSVMREDGEPSMLRGFMIDITERKQAEETFRTLVEASASTSGLELFRSLVSHLGTALGVRYAFVGEFFEGNTKARTLVFWTRDGFVDNIEYPLADTPCQQVLHGEMQYFPEQVQALFPKDQDLVTLEAEGYLALPLRDAVGNVLGHLAVIDDKPMPVQIREIALIQIFAARAAAELVREQTEEALKEQRAFLRQVIDIDPNFIFAKDREGRFTLVNQAVADAYGTTVEDLIGKTDADFNANVEEVEFFQRMDREVIDTLQERFIQEEAITDAQGNLRWLQTVKRPIIGEDGTANQVLGSATDITRRKRGEEALREREAILQRNQKDLQDLAGKLLTAQEAERRRLAREMHDDLTQRLAVLAIEAGKLEGQIESYGEGVPEKLRHMKEQMMKLAADVHAISRQLHPSILDDLGLVDAMDAECTSFSQREGILVTYEPENVPETLPKELGLCLYRITQEALRNIAKHAQAREARVSLFGKDGVIILRIEDFGVGFDAAQMAGKRGLGLASMEERARLVRAELRVDSRPGRGTVIEVRAPLRGRT